jgi:drug/metabolite transporter (DMT)-like permease
VGEAAVAARTATELAAPSRADFLLICVAVAGVSTSGPLIAATAVPALAIGFWRNAMAAAALLPAAALRHRPELRRLSARDWQLMLAAGALLACHFGLWITSIRYTSVGSATAFVATQPAWAALIARGRGAAIGRLAWLGIAVAIGATGLLAGLDLRLSGRAAFGDLLALVAGLFAAGYMTTGSVVRRSVGTTAYTATCYATTAILLLFASLVAGQAVSGYAAPDWLRLGALTLAAQLLGHSVFNRVLKTTSPTVVSLSILFEVPGATIIAALALHQQVHLLEIPAALLLLTGLALVIRSGGRAIPAE